VAESYIPEASRDAVPRKVTTTVYGDEVVCIISRQLIEQFKMRTHDGYLVTASVYPENPDGTHTLRFDVHYDDYFGPEM
jgi:hypothetical protein